MNIKDFQRIAEGTENEFRNEREKLLFLALGLSEEAGELDNSVKQFLRKNKNKKEIKDSLGDILWYLAEISNYFNWSIEDIADENNRKLKKRYHDKK